VLARVFGLQRMGVLALLGIGGLAFVGVPMNALFFQDGRHPAPLFSGRLPAPDKSMAALTPTPPTRPGQIETGRLEGDAAKLDAAHAKASPRTDAAALKDIIKSDAVPAPKAEKKRDAHDPIGALLGGDAPAPAPDAVAPAQVVMAQRALQRLGYVVKPDGRMGAGTRQAIEKFERDNRLPVKGELSPKVVRLLATRAAAARD
jgi:hypothetical protein